MFHFVYSSVINILRKKWLHVYKKLFSDIIKSYIWFILQSWFNLKDQVEWLCQI